ncbi:MAG: glutathione peroxidase, partial [Planctomycetes bacterium]|nr:glutathione peroxidase [Planctomycetota bacterium]
MIQQAQDTKTEEKPEAAENDTKTDEEANEGTELPEDSLYRLKTKTLEGQDADLSDYAGKVALLVNVASKCGYTPQYEGLEKLYDELKDKDFVILAFPSNDFRGQEPGTPEEIRKFCTDNYEVSFPLFEKVQTKEGEGQSAIYANLQKQLDELPSWNFCKYLIGKDGKAIKFYASKVKPDDADMRKAIDEALKVEFKKSASDGEGESETEDGAEKPTERPA